MADNASDNDGAADGAFRAKLGIWLVVWTAGALAFLALAVIIAAAFTGNASDVLDASKQLLTALLPLFGTWVGTVLAFYYTRANYEAASKGTLDVVKSLSQRLTSTKVSEKMMGSNSVIKITVPSIAEIGKVVIQEVIDGFNTVGGNGRKISRLIFVDASGAGIAILHKSIWVEMMNNIYAKGSFDPKLTLDTTINENYGSSTGKTYLDFITSTVGYIGRDQSMADAKAKMEAIPQCQDLFVTQTGQRTEQMVGWLTNVDISVFSQAQ